MSTITTQVARALFDDHELFGRRVFAELAGRVSASALFALAITGRLPSEDDARVLDAIACVLSVADPRIWPLKIARLGASRGSALAGYAASILSIESDLIGPWTAGRAATAFVELRARVEGEKDRTRAIVRFFEGTRRITGFGVPIRRADERVIAMRACLAELGRTSRPFWSLAEETWRALEADRGLAPNVGSALSAAILDLGFGPEEVPPLSFALTQPAILANAIEGAALCSEELLVLPRASMRYVGPAPRPSPRSEAV